MDPNLAQKMHVMTKQVLDKRQTKIWNDILDQIQSRAQSGFWTTCFVKLSADDQSRLLMCGFQINVLSPENNIQVRWDILS